MRIIIKNTFYSKLIMSSQTSEDNYLNTNSLINKSMDNNEPTKKKI